jgi:hypothetical protein
MLAVFLFVALATVCALPHSNDTFVLCATNPNIYPTWYSCCNLAFVNSPWASCKMTTIRSLKVTSTASLGIFGSSGYSFSFVNDNTAMPDGFFDYTLDSLSAFEIARAKNESNGFLLLGRFHDSIGSTNFTLQVI